MFGYDVLVLVEYLNLQVQFFTDFQSFVGEAFVLEVSTPALPAYPPLTAAAGVGVALRQLDGREEEAAVRLQATLYPLVVYRILVGIDIWPASGEVSFLASFLTIGI